MYVRPDITSLVIDNHCYDDSPARHSGQLARLASNCLTPIPRDIFERPSTPAHILHSYDADTFLSSDSECPSPHRAIHCSTYLDEEDAVGSFAAGLARLAMEHDQAAAADPPDMQEPAQLISSVESSPEPEASSTVPPALPTIPDLILHSSPSHQLPPDAAACSSPTQESEDAQCDAYTEPTAEIDASTPPVAASEAELATADTPSAGAEPQACTDPPVSQPNAEDDNEDEFGDFGDEDDFGDFGDFNDSAMPADAFADFTAAAAAAAGPSSSDIGPPSTPINEQTPQQQQQPSSTDAAAAVANSVAEPTDLLLLHDVAFLAAVQSSWSSLHTQQPSNMTHPTAEEARALSACAPSTIANGPSSTSTSSPQDIEDAWESDSVMAQLRAQLDAYMARSATFLLPGSCSSEPTPALRCVSAFGV